MEEHRPIQGLGEIALRVRLGVTTADHEWTQWRSLYVNDPEGNVVEWVCYDPTVVN